MPLARRHGSVTPVPPTPSFEMPPRRRAASHAAGVPAAGETAEAAAGVPSIDTEADLDRAIAALAGRDPALVARLLAVGGRPPLRRRAPGFEGLAALVVSQQVSTASAAAIFGRLRAALAPPGSAIEAADLAAAGDAVLRAAGLSAGKVLTLRAAAAAVLDGRLRLDALAALPAEAAAARLTALRGIGPWTAQLYLLSCLGHADAWPPGDVALEEAARSALGLDARPGAAALARIAERWRPHRAVAARLLWGYYRAVKARGGLGIGLGDGG